MSNIDMLRGIDSGFISRYRQEVLSNADMLRVIDSGFIRRYGQEVMSNTDSEVYHIGRYGHVKHRFVYI